MKSHSKTPKGLNHSAQGCAPRATLGNPLAKSPNPNGVASDLLAIPFAELVKQQRGSVVEVLQLWGDFPYCNEQRACALDWQHVLMSHLSDLFEHTRLDESDPEVTKDIRRRLARIVATCEAWDTALTTE